MSERALRGSRLGSSSYESDEGVDIVPRQQVPYDCPQGHRFTVPFSVEAEIPPLWECRLCGAEATVANGDEAQPKQLKPPRTHWDMLLERRSIPELEELLKERLELLRSDRDFLLPSASSQKEKTASTGASAKKTPAAKKSATGKKTTETKKSTAKKSTTKKTTETKKSTAEKTTAEKSTAVKKAAPTKKTASKKTSTKKTPSSPKD